MADKRPLLQYEDDDDDDDDSTQFSSEIYGSTLNSRRAASPLVWLVEGEERWEASDHPQGFLPLNWGRTEQNRTVTCMVFKAKANDRRKNSSL
ncbi:uncharacterized protein TNCV_2141331 [Trichonephila clavipes]|uniref:Uncharacterized protein n=1 Tax=Trichonephila clavipes TaxID=2585209 RepID=A0A8X6S2B4_TRICX|nr:uncharacterized protein TNCV_2141331 [Trichonephila clavipes]